MNSPGWLSLPAAAVSAVPLCHDCAPAAAPTVPFDCSTGLSEHVPTSQKLMYTSKMLILLRDTVCIDVKQVQS